MHALLSHRKYIGVASGESLRNINGLN